MPDSIESRLDRIESKLDRALFVTPETPVVSPVEAMLLTGCRSTTAQYRWFQKYNVQPYTKGKYRRLDITNRVAGLARLKQQYENH